MNTKLLIMPINPVDYKVNVMYSSEYTNVV